MLVYEVHGAEPLQGEVEISGSKNAALPILAATLLTDKPVYLRNLPSITDIDSMLECLASLGKTISRIDKHCVLLHSSNCNEILIPDIATRIRASVLLLGPLFARHPHVVMPHPGGCSIGARPINLHIQALQSLGVEIEEKAHTLEGKRTEQYLQANVIDFPKKTVTGTENVIMAATLAKGITTITNAACEPEIVDLCNFLNKLGATITGAGTDIIQIKGCDYLNGCENYTVMSDRIEASTYLIAGAITRGRVKVTNINPELLAPTLEALQTAGASLHCEHNAVEIDMREREGLPINLITAPFPGLPTDIQSPFLSLATTLPGKSIISETLFENRFQMVPELQKMGAQITVEGNTAHINGGVALKGASLRATDLRSGAALVCVALATPGRSFITEPHHIERGYEDFVTKLQNLGANITQSNLQAAHHSGFFKLSPPEGIEEEIPKKRKHP